VKEIPADESAFASAFTRKADPSTASRARQTAARKKKRGASFGMTHNSPDDADEFYALESEVSSESSSDTVLAAWYSAMILRASSA